MSASVVFGALVRWDMIMVLAFPVSLSDSFDTSEILCPVAYYSRLASRDNIFMGNDLHKRHETEIMTSVLYCCQKHGAGGYFIGIAAYRAMKATSHHIDKLATLHNDTLTRKVALFPRKEGDVDWLQVFMLSHLFFPCLPFPQHTRMSHLLSPLVDIKHQKYTIRMNIYMDEFTSQGDAVFSRHNLPTPPSRRLTPHTTTVVMATMRQRPDWLRLR